MTDLWDLIYLGGIRGIETQTIWHAAALARSRGIQHRDMLCIDWPVDPIVCIGYHQILDLEVDEEYCSLNNIPIVRRSCGGGAVFLDGDQLFYQPIIHKTNRNFPRKVEAFYKKMLKPVVATYQHFGIDAYYKPVNDVMVGSRKISGNGAGQLEDTQFLIGNFILDFPRKTMAKILKVPYEKMREKVEKSLEKGISSFKHELGVSPSKDEIMKEYIKIFKETFDIEFKSKSLENATKNLMKELEEMYNRDKWLRLVSSRSPNALVKAIKIHGSQHIIQSLYKSPGGLLRFLFEIRENTLEDILISGDFWLITDLGDEGIQKLEEELRGQPFDPSKLEDVVNSFFENYHVQTPGTTPKDFRVVFDQAQKAWREKS